MTYLTHWLNYPETGAELEINEAPSQTQPDEVLSIREMLQRHVRGLPVNGGPEGTYLPEELGHVPDLRSLDLTELEEYRDHFKEQSARIEKEASERDALAKKEAAEEAALQEAIKQAHIKSKQPPKQTEE